MRVNNVSSGSNVEYVSMEDRMKLSIYSRISRAQREGKTSIDFLVRDCPATQKVIEELKESFDVQVEKSDNMKLTVNWS